jgi:hypothetical protein
MMKKIGVLLLALTLFSAMVAAVEPAFAPTEEQQRDEVQMDSAYLAYLAAHPGAGCVGDCSADPALHTQLTANLEVMGDVSNSGDTFVARSTITNVGTATAYYVLGYLSADELMGLPAGWVVENNNGDNFYVWNQILPGESKTFDFIVTRDAQDATIVLKAMAENCVKATSQRIKVPVSPLVLGGIAVSMIGMLAVSQRKKKFI